MSKKQKILIVILIVTAISIYAFYGYAKKQGKYIPLPPNTANDQYAPEQDVLRLHEAFTTWGVNLFPLNAGTNEDVLWEIFENRTKRQLAVLYNAYLAKYNVTLLDEFGSELGDDSLRRAANYFEGLV